MSKFLLLVALAFSFSSFALTNAEVEKIREGIKLHLHEARDCYASGAEKGEGKIVVGFEIDGKGRVTRTSVIEDRSTFKDEAVRSCLLERAKTWTFKVPAGGPYEVKYPFSFRGKK